MKVLPLLPISIPACAGVLLATTALCLADTVTLKSGEVLNGKILSETNREIVMDVTVAAGITDQKTIDKTDVRAAEKTPLDEIAFQEIKGCQIDNHSLPASSYVAIIKSLESFLKKYPQSSRVDEVQSTLAAFKHEQEQVKAGCMKWDNQWYTKEEAEKNKYRLAAQMQFAAMRDQASRRDCIGALNTFDLIEKWYPGSNVYPDAVELAQSMIRTVCADMERIRVNAKAQEAQFNNGIVLVTEPQKSQMIAARQAQVTTAEAALAAAERAGVKWKPLLAMASKSFESLKTTIGTEAPRLEALPLADIRKSIASIKDAEAALSDNNAAGAEVKVKEAQKLWSVNGEVAALTAEIEAFKKKPTPTPIPKPTATPTPTPKPVAQVTTPPPTPTPKKWHQF
ncbi:MAG: PTPDL family protein [Verrucomicrobiota bacterium]